MNKSPITLQQLIELNVDISIKNLSKNCDYLIEEMNMN